MGVGVDGDVERPQYSQYVSGAFYGSDADLNAYGLDGAQEQGRVHSADSDPRHRCLPSVRDRRASASRAVGQGACQEGRDH